MDSNLTTKGVKIRIRKYWRYLGKKDGMEILDKLTSHHQPRIGQRQTIHNYIYGKNSIYLPRFVIDKLGDDYFNINNTLLGLDTDLSDDLVINPLIEPYNNQKVVIDYLMNNYFTARDLLKGRSAVIVCAKTGFGKTILSFTLSYILKQKTIMIVPNKNVQSQTYTELKKFFSNTRICFLGGMASAPKNSEIKSDCTLAESNICIAIINSTIKAINNDKNFMSQFGLCIYDEVHTIKSDKSKVVFWRGQCKYSLGLTATPNEREDNKDKIYKVHFSDIVYADDIEGFEANEHKFKCHVNFINYIGPAEFTYTLTNDKTGMCDPSAIMTNIINDPYRLIFIGRLLKKILESTNRCILAFSDRRDYATQVYNELLTEHFDDNEQMRGVILLGGGKNDDAMKYARDEARIIFTTYKFSKVGFNVPKINTIVFLTPEKAEHGQKVGRALRFGSDINITRHFYDIIDVKTIFFWQKKKRQLIYDELESTYSSKSVNYESIISTNTE